MANGSPADTDRWTDMAKLKATSCDYVNVPKIDVMMRWTCTIWAEIKKSTSNLGGEIFQKGTTLNTGTITEG